MDIDRRQFNNCVLAGAASLFLSNNFDYNVQCSNTYFIHSDPPAPQDLIGIDYIDVTLPPMEQGFLEIICDGEILEEGLVNNGMYCASGQWIVDCNWGDHNVQLKLYNSNGGLEFTNNMLFSHN